MRLLDNIPQINISFKSRQECDDDYVVYEGGEIKPVIAGPSDKDKKLYDASMFKLKLVSFVSTFFIIA